MSYCTVCLIYENSGANLHVYFIENIWSGTLLLFLLQKIKVDKRVNKRQAYSEMYLNLKNTVLNVVFLESSSIKFVLIFGHCHGQKTTEADIT